MRTILLVSRSISTVIICWRRGLLATAASTILTALRSWLATLIFSEQQMICKLHSTRRPSLSLDQLTARTRVYIASQRVKGTKPLARGFWWMVALHNSRMLTSCRPRSRAVLKSQLWRLLQHSLPSRSRKFLQWKGFKGRSLLRLSAARFDHLSKITTSNLS